jgi:hypothetical protein
MTSQLPSNANLKQLRHRAKDLLKAHKNGNPSCCVILRNLHRFEGKTDQEIGDSDVSLVDVQFAIALEYGFKGWRDMKEHVTEASGERAPGQLDMPAPGNEPGNTYARGMSAALSYLGTEMSYDQVMGLSGVAFILQLDTSGPFIDEELDCAWWPNDAWGFDLGLPVLSQAAGWELRKVRHDVESHRIDAAAEYRRAFASVVEQSLAAGKPVLAEHDHCFIVTAIDAQEPPLLGYGTRGKSTQFEDVFRISCHPWGLIVFGKAFTPRSSEEMDLASLCHTIALFNEQGQGAHAPETRFSGRQAWAEWLNLLRAGSACDNNMLIHLRYNRRSAVAYLRHMLTRYSGDVAKHLSAAVDLYQRVVDDAMQQGLPWNRVKNGEDEQIVRSEYTAMVERVSQTETQAVAELEAAAASMSATP